MINLSNVDDANRERVFLTLSYNWFAPLHIAESTTYSASASISAINTQSTNVANIATSLVKTTNKLITSLIAGRVYSDAGIGGTGHGSEDGSVHDRADFYVAKASKIGGIGGSGNVPGDMELSRLHISELAKHVNNVVAPGGVSGTGHVDGDVVFPGEGAGVVVAHIDGGMAGTGHISDTDSLDMLAVIASGSLKGNNTLLATTGINGSILMLDSTDTTSDFNGFTGEAVTYQIVASVNNGQQPHANSDFLDNQPDVAPDWQWHTTMSASLATSLKPDVAPDWQWHTTTGSSGKETSIAVSLLFDEPRLLSNHSDSLDSDGVMEPGNTQSLALPTCIYELLNEFNHATPQSFV